MISGRLAQRGTLALDVILTPALTSSDPSSRRHEIAIVVDVIRATTTLCVAFERGCRRVYVAPGLSEARAYRDAARSELLLAGESGGVAPAGFDLGNSPVEFSEAAITGRDLIFATTNGTRALRVCEGSRAIFAGAFRNAGAVCAAALVSARREWHERDGIGSLDVTEAAPGRASEASWLERGPDIVIVCSGRGDRPAYDDTVCAGYLASRIVRAGAAEGYAIHLREGARIAMATADEALRTGDLRAALAVSEAAQATERVGLGGDLDWCVAIDATDIVPVVAGATGDGMLIVEELARETTP